MKYIDQSPIVQHLLDSLTQIEQDTQNALQKLTEIYESDTQFGYAKATGYAQAKLQLIGIRASVCRSSYETNDA